MQEQYTKVQIADMMEDEFPDDAGLGKFIKFCEDLPALRKRAEILKRERIQVFNGEPKYTDPKPEHSQRRCSPNRTPDSDGAQSNRPI